MSRGQVLAIFIAFGGIVLLLKPTGGFLEQESLLALGGGFFAGLAYTVVRRLKGESPYSITFFFMVFSVIVSFPLALWQGMHGQIKLRYPDALSVFVVPESMEELEKQIRERYNDTASADLRVNKASMEMELSSLFRHQVKNSDAQKAKEEIARMLAEHKAKAKG